MLKFYLKILFFLKILFYPNKKVLKDKLIRYKFSNYEKKKYLYQFLIYNISLKFNRRLMYSIPFYKRFSKKCLFTQINNRCVFSGKKRGIMSKYKISRHFFKKFVSRGQITDILKN